MMRQPDCRPEPVTCSRKSLGWCRPWIADTTDADAGALDTGI